MPINLVFSYESQKVKAPVPSPPNVDASIKVGGEVLGIPKDSFDLYDRYGKIEMAEDLQRAIHMAGTADCIVEVREHEHYKRLRGVEVRHDHVDTRLARIEDLILNNRSDFDKQLQEARNESKDMGDKLNKRLDNEIKPVLDALIRDKNRLQKDVRNIEEKLSQIDVQELKMIAAQTIKLRDEVKDSVKKVNAMQEAWTTDKAKLTQMCMQSQQDLHELQRYIQGKIDVCIEADADLRREQQLCSERMQLVADDLRLLTDEHGRLMRQCAGALEESEELRTLLGQVREDNEHLLHDHGQVKTRVCVLEGQATEKWEGFMPGVLYFRSWHRSVKGDDVQFSPDVMTATGRGFLASTGMVIGNHEGLVVADGPCRRFGTPGCYSSYYELEVDEVKQVPAGMGGLWVGVALQSCEEIAKHPSLEFDGWLVGGASKAMVCRAGTPPDLPVDADKLPGTFAPGASEGVGMGNVKQAMQLLRAALPPRPIGEMREFGSMWNSQSLKMGDRIGVLWRCNRDVGARLRVSVNGTVVVTQEFVDAPTAEAVGFFTPVVRLAGSGKSVKLLPGLSPPTRMLVDN